MKNAQVVIGAATLGLALVVGGLALAANRSVEVPFGSRIHHDDFYYSVVGVTRVKSMSSASSPVGRPAVTAQINVESEAKRVDYEWRSDTVFLEDEQGRRYRAEPDLSKPVTIPPGGHATVNATFFVQPDARNLKLGYWDGILMGDVFDGMQYARARIAIPDEK